MNSDLGGAYTTDDDIVDFILGITYEIWEQGGLELINKYYGQAAPVFSLDGVVHGAAAVIDGTSKMLESYPDRLLFGDDVIWSGNRRDGYYSSHRVVSPMTNTGPTPFGPATGRRVTIMNIADCIVDDGVITREWLLRDNHALSTQLGFEPQAAAAALAENRDEGSRRWLAAETDRVRDVGLLPPGPALSSPGTDAEKFAAMVLNSLWSNGDTETIAAAYAPYAVLHRSPVSHHSGRGAIDWHYAGLRNAINVAGVAIDHVAVQPCQPNGLSIAARWSVAGTHSGEFLGCPATGKPVYILGASHWRVIADRIVADWTVFDGVGVLSQLV